jgi:subtilisin family serine protease
VGASLTDDMRWPGSCFGLKLNGIDGLDLLAPGGAPWIETLDESNAIYNYGGSFRGTSAAAPMVSAVAANMLCVNPCLSNKAIVDILRNTADKVQSIIQTAIQ